MLEMVLRIQRSSSELLSELLRVIPTNGLFRRHLMRLWLRDPENAWETPEALKQRWDHVYGGVTPKNIVFPLQPHIRSSSAGNKAATQNGASR